MKYQNKLRLPGKLQIQSGGTFLERRGLLLTTYSDRSHCLQFPVNYILRQVSPLVIGVEYNGTEINRYQLDSSQLLYINYDETRKIYHSDEMVFKFERVDDNDNLTDLEIAEYLKYQCFPTLIHLTRVENPLFERFPYDISIMVKTTGSIDQLKFEWLKSPIEKTLCKLNILEIFVVTCSILYQKGLYYIDTKPENIFYVDDREYDSFSVVIGDLGSICGIPDKSVGITYPIIKTRSLRGPYNINSLRKDGQEIDVLYGILILLLSLFVSTESCQILFNHSRYHELYHGNLKNLTVGQFNHKILLLQEAIETAKKNIVNSVKSHSPGTNCQSLVDNVFNIFDFTVNAEGLTVLTTDKNLDQIYVDVLLLRLEILHLYRPKIDVSVLENDLIREYFFLTTEKDEDEDREDEVTED